MARALLVVPRTRFSCNLYRRARDLLERQGIQVQVASSIRGEIRAPECTVMADARLEEVRGADYDLVVFVAGRGNRDLLDSAEAHRVAREALEAGKVVGATGLAVAILANAGLLRGRKAAGPISVAVLLREKGADYTADPVAADDGLVTLRRSEAFPAFGQELLARLPQAEVARKAA